MMEGTLNNMDGIRNLKSQKMFILVEDEGEEKIRVINPNGEVLLLSRELFEDTPIQVGTGDLDSFFSQEQLTSLDRYVEKMKLEDIEAKERDKRIQTETFEEHRERDTLGVSRPKRKSTSRKPSLPGGIKSSWNASQFVLYRHKIDPLKPKECFCITVEGEGDYVIMKDDFLKIFNDVIMSPSYIREGIFKFPETPDRAKRFLRNPK